MTRERLALCAACLLAVADADLVIGIAIGGQARAYPVNLRWQPQNEALNDRPATALWYAWSSQRPGTTLWGAEPGR